MFSKILIGITIIIFNLFRTFKLKFFNCNSCSAVFAQEIKRVDSVINESNYFSSLSCEFKYTKAYIIPGDFSDYLYLYDTATGYAIFQDITEIAQEAFDMSKSFGTEESKKIWEENAQFWDNAMGDESNEFHREVVRPKVTELLSPNPADYILDIACGNGNYSSYLAQRGASVVAFDYSKKMIELAKRRQSQYAKQIEFCVADATDRKSILEQQFTAFKPLAHRPKPMLAKP